MLFRINRMFVECSNDVNRIYFDTMKFFCIAKQKHGMERFCFKRVFVRRRLMCQLKIYLRYFTIRSLCVLRQVRMEIEQITEFFTEYSILCADRGRKEGGGRRTVCASLQLSPYPDSFKSRSFPPILSLLDEVL